MTAPDLTHAKWRKSSRSTTEANCVEVAFAPEAVAIRDTKDRDGGTLAVPTTSWTAFRHSQS